MSDLEKTIQEIGDLHKEHSDILKGCVKEKDLGKHVDVLLTEKQEKISSRLSDLEEKAAAFVAVQDELSNLKKSDAFRSGEAQDNSEKRKAVLNDLLRKGVGMENNQPMDLSQVKDADQHLFTKALTTSPDADGGFVTTDEMEGAISLLEKERSPVRNIVTILSGTAPGWKQPVQLTRFGASRVAETAARPETTTSTFAEQVIKAEELYANPAVSQVMLDDANFDIVGYLNSQIADEFLITEGAEFVTGAGPGSNEFQGITTFADGTTFGTLERIQSNGTLAITYEDFVNMDETLLPAFTNGASWLMNRSTRAEARKLLDGDLRPLLQPDLPNGGLPQIFGKTIVDVPDMPASGVDTNLPIAYGDFRRSYLIYDRMGIRILRDPYTNNPFVMFYTTKRSGGDVVNHQGIKLLEINA
jgi:HK97 family phage major capsid protein